MNLHLSIFLLLFLKLLFKGRTSEFAISSGQLLYSPLIALTRKLKLKGIGRNNFPLYHRSSREIWLREFFSPY